MVGARWVCGTPMLSVCAGCVALFVLRAGRAGEDALLRIWKTGMPPESTDPQFSDIARPPPVHPMAARRVAAR